MSGTDTGRLASGLGPRTTQHVYGDPDRFPLDELELISRVDLAHLVMLARRSLIDPAAAATLLHAIDEARTDGFTALRGRPAPRGTYLMYESWLSERTGPHIGGLLHTGRSRNDLKACTSQLALRAWGLTFAHEAVRLAAVVLSRSRRHRDTVMPIYTHFQAAVPGTYGHYLLGVATALTRDVGAVLDAATGLDRCALGAGAVAGTDLPIDPDLTADLLGFRAGPRHAVDAVASRDVHLRMLGAVAGLGLTISRLATDLQLWSTAEFGMIEFPERLVGGSSAMPQKRNAFLLEHIKADAGTAVGSWTAAASIMRSTPFTNSIEVGTEAVAATWTGLTAVARAVGLTQVCVSGARPVAARMARRAEDGFTVATSVANELVRAGIPFRTAHRAVGAAVRAAVDGGTTSWPAGHVRVDGLDRPITRTDPADVARATDQGGGPGRFDPVFDAVHRDLTAHAARRRSWAESVTAAEGRLRIAVTTTAHRGLVGATT